MDALLLGGKDQAFLEMNEHVTIESTAPANTIPAGLAPVLPVKWGQRPEAPCVGPPCPRANDWGRVLQFALSQEATAYPWSRHILLLAVPSISAHAFLPTQWLSTHRAGKGPVTSLISLILEPPLPIREPHWLAGTTNLSVTGGLLVAGLLLMELMMSWGWRKVCMLADSLCVNTESAGVRLCSEPLTARGQGAQARETSGEGPSLISSQSTGKRTSVEMHALDEGAHTLENGRVYRERAQQPGWADYRDLKAKSGSEEQGESSGMDRRGPTETCVRVAMVLLWTGQGADGRAPGLKA